MEKIIDSLLEDIKNNWDEEDLGMFLCNVYALGHLDSETEKEAEANQIFLLMCANMRPDIVNEYIINQLFEGDDEFDFSLEIDDEENNFLDY